MPDKVYRTRSGFKVTCWVLAVVCTVLVVLFPFGVLMLWIAYEASVRAVGVVAGMLRPLSYQLRSKPSATPRLALGAFEGSDEILAELTRRTGHQIAA